MLSRAVIVSDERPHPLYDAVCWQVKEGLQLIINAEHQHISLGISGKNGIQRGNQKRRQRQIQDGGNADAVQP